MNNYKRIISYLYYYGSGEKKNNVGYVRMERKNGICKVTIHMRSINSNDKKLGVYFFYREKEQLVGISLGTMVIKKGVGEFRKVMEEEITKGLQVTLEEMGGIIIYENNEHFFATQWDDEFINIMNFYIAEGNDESGWNREKLKEKDGEELKAANLMEVGIQEVELDMEESKKENLEVEEKERNLKIESAEDGGGNIGIEREEKDLGGNGDCNTGEDVRRGREENGRRDLGGNGDCNTREDVRRGREENGRRDLGENGDCNTREDVKRGREENGRRDLGGNGDCNTREDVRRGREENSRRDLGGNGDCNIGEDVRIERGENERRNLENRRYEYHEENERAGRVESKRENPGNEREKNEEENIRIVREESGNGTLRERNVQYQGEDLISKENIEQEEYLKGEGGEDSSIEIERLKLEQGNENYFNHSRISKINEAIEKFSARTNRKLQNENIIGNKVIRTNIKDNIDEKTGEDNNIKEYIYMDKRIENGWRQQVRNQQRKLERKMELAEKLFEKFPPIDICNKDTFKKCVKIEPQDIGNFPMETWVLANNSFLLHGYYQYRYLIFALHFHEKQWEYVIGVPGIYEPRERFMAGMFGFGNFCPTNDKEAKTGTFGYWYQVIRL